MVFLEMPAWLLALPPLLLVVWMLGRERAGFPDHRRRLRLAWRMACLSALVLALAGLRFPSQRSRIDVVAAVDLSDSIYDRKIQEASLGQLAAHLKDTDARLGVVTFGATAVAERPLAPLPDPADPARRDLPPLPVLSRSVVSGSATDIGAALDRSRSLLDETASGRAIVLISDGQDTAGQAAERASALRGSGIDLLAWPATLGGTDDVLLAGLHLPDRAHAGQGAAIEVTVSAQRAAQVRVRLGRRVEQGLEPIDTQNVTLAPVGREFRATLRFIDHPPRPGVTVYVATVEGPDGQTLPGDYRQNNVLVGALKVDGPSRWLAVARRESTLEAWSKRSTEALGIEMTCLPPERLPTSLDDYVRFTGVLIGDLSAAELPDNAPGLKALSNAISNGLALVALGGEQAFGAGKHTENGNWERLLPVTFRPEDDRTRSILFVLDVSDTMNGQLVGRQERKLAFACSRLGEVAQPGPNANLRATDRVGLIAFANQALTKAPLANDPQRTVFREELTRLQPGQQTNFLGALELARTTLAGDDAEEQLVIFVSDGEPTPMIPDEELEKAVKALCPGEGEKRRTRLHAFGIATGAADRNPAGEKRLTNMAQAGGGKFFPDFTKLAKALKELLQDKPPEFYVRREAFNVQSSFPQHPLLVGAGPWPELRFRNRVRARPEALTLAQSAPLRDAAGPRKSDPLLVLGHYGLGQTAALALTLDGPDGQRFLAAGDGWRGGQAFLAALLAWVERGDEQARAAWQIETVERGNRLQILVDAREATSRKAKNGLQLSTRLLPVFGTAAPITGELLPVAPGRYEGWIELPQREMAKSEEFQALYRLELLQDGLMMEQRHISVPYPQEYRHFGTDRTALAEWVQRAGGRSRMLDVPNNLEAWLREVETQRDWVSARPALMILAALCLLAEVATRGLRRRAGR